MTITNQGAVANSGSSTTLSATLGAAPSNGDLLVAWCGSSKSISVSTGWTQLTLAAQGTTLFFAWHWKIAGAAESATQTVATSTVSGAWRVHLLRYSASAGWYTSGGSLILDEDNLAIATADNPILTTNLTPIAGLEALIVTGYRGAGASTHSGESINGSTTGVTEWTDANAQATADFIVSSTSGAYQGSDVPSATATSNEYGSIAIFTPVLNLPPLLPTPQLQVRMLR